MITAISGTIGKPISFLALACVAGVNGEGEGERERRRKMGLLTHCSFLIG